jgi:hypothetical protein
MVVLDFGVGGFGVQVVDDDIDGDAQIGLIEEDGQRCRIDVE